MLCLRITRWPFHNAQLIFPNFVKLMRNQNRILEGRSCILKVPVLQCVYMSHFSPFPWKWSSNLVSLGSLNSWFFLFLFLLLLSHTFRSKVLCQSSCPGSCRDPTWTRVHLAALGGPFEFCDVVTSLPPLFPFSGLSHMLPHSAKSSF